MPIFQIWNDRPDSDLRHHSVKDYEVLPDGMRITIKGFENEQTMFHDNGHNESNHFREAKPETEEKYRQAIELYRSTRLSCAKICRICKVTVSGFQGYLSKYHRDLLLARYDITCSKEEARHIKLGQLRGQLPATRAKVHGSGVPAEKYPLRGGDTCRVV